MPMGGRQTRKRSPKLDGGAAKILRVPPKRWGGRQNFGGPDGGAAKLDGRHYLRVLGDLLGDLFGGPFGGRILGGFR